LAKEIDDFVKRNELHVHRLTFIAHSMGGIVTRAALTTDEMKPFIPLLHTFISLASPHLGVVYGSTVNRESRGALGFFASSVIWLYQKWTQSVSLQQLRMADHPNLRQTYLYRLSQMDHMKSFQNIFLLASQQDAYVPSPSALIDSNVIGVDPELAQVCSEMMNNLMKPLAELRFEIYYYHQELFLFCFVLYFFFLNYLISGEMFIVGKSRFLIVMNS
jgi:pimeloyl-ACP methyl ester carboxylesterase